MLVHLWQTRRSNNEFHLIKSNHPLCFPTVTACWSYPSVLCGIDIGRANQLVAPPYTAAPAPSMAARSYAIQPVYATQMTRMPRALAQVAIYSANSNGMPVNVTDGAILTEPRGIFIRNLSYEVTSEELKLLISTVKKPLECEVNYHPSGVSKGRATAKFASYSEAHFGATRLDKTAHRRRILTVRLDQENTIVRRIRYPLVVNGSVGVRGGVEPRNSRSEIAPGSTAS